ncbi:hypothetical protein GLYMA_02G189250v4 [Glycine max]|uniref:uncharacterized protein isoform X1 n=1 Tax=Glycine max TaxID=3847 RepID=UPI0007190B86|nr:uncharacterized protein LOC102663410 isoform X1 [Glycine max]XP_014623754.1 uncharacterized protein LOC102663410 isoform X1 [Glycine max]KAG4402406.1 hypothetical protein GLYMA_02G189250v4 [Glycine max]KAH1061042.1 hypothetical protein GYH30_004508 [Glycine max]|eukprot:XP_014623752.1 uncharacterized protein LOC102663410 isoform X1 [Glycine max]
MSLCCVRVRASRLSLYAYVKGRKVESKGLHSVPVSGAPVILQSGIPLPDKRTLELILDKLHKKDTYGVFADPVDPEELPDYHDVIKHPMDFATVRKKLGNESSYTTLEQFEVYKQGPKTRASVAGVTSINLAEYVPAAVDKETEIVVPLNVPGTNDITNLSLFWHKIQNITTSPSFVPEFEENSFTVGSWEQKEVISRDGQMKLHKYIFYEHA